MSFQLLGVLAAATLISAGVGGTSETRSSQSLPVQSLTLPQAHPGITSKLRLGNRLADAEASQSDETRCRRSHGRWDHRRLRCRRNAWLFDPGGTLLIGAGTIAGIIVALTEVNHSGSGSGAGGGGTPISF